MVLVVKRLGGGSLELHALRRSPIKSLCGRGTLCVMHTLETVSEGS